MDLKLQYIKVCNNVVGDKEDKSDKEDKKEVLTVSKLFPIEQDVYMKYQGSGNEYAEYETYVEFTSDDVIQIRRVNSGATTAEVFIIENGSVKKVYSKGETYYRFNYLDLRNSTEVILMEPIEEGTSWTLEDGAARSITAINKEIEVPAGKYRAVEVTTERADFITRHYYVEGIGLIKNEFESKDFEDFPITSELERIERNIPMKVIARIFFPDFNNDRVVYIARNIELNTNDDIIKSFESQLKSIPEGSELTPTLTPNTRILDLQINEDAGIVTVDLSEHFFDELNAGISLESMIIMSLTDTFGMYFQLNRVIITTNGKPYSSGHVELKDGEYFIVDT